MNTYEKIVAVKGWNEKEYENRFLEKIKIISTMALNASKQYQSTYRQGGIQMRFADIFRKYKRLENEFIDGVRRTRESVQDDLLDLTVYSIVMSIYLDELEEAKEMTCQNQGRLTVSNSESTSKQDQKKKD